MSIELTKSEKKKFSKVSQSDDDPHLSSSSPSSHTQLGEYSVYASIFSCLTTAFTLLDFFQNHQTLKLLNHQHDLYFLSFNTISQIVLIASLLYLNQGFALSNLHRQETDLTKKKVKRVVWFCVMQMMMEVYGSVMQVSIFQVLEIKQKGGLAMSMLINLVAVVMQGAFLVKSMRAN